MELSEELNGLSPKILWVHIASRVGVIVLVNWNDRDSIDLKIALLATTKSTQVIIRKVTLFTLLFEDIELFLKKKSIWVDKYD